MHCAAPSALSSALDVDSHAHKEAANMITAHTNLSLPGVVVGVLSSCLVAEFTGYWLHRLLHCDKVPFLSRGHLIHHFLVYGPRQSMRSTGYKDATDGRFSVGNIGLEWLIPSAVVLAFCWGIMALFAVPHAYQIVSLCTLLIWPIFMFNYLHDRMHLKNFWMSRVPLLRIWYIGARKLHDVHHLRLNNEGRMDTNFGIGFFFFDRIFRTIAMRHRTFNWVGYGVAKKRYGLVDPVGCDAPMLLEDSPWQVGGRAKGQTTRADHECEPGATMGVRHE
jgi:sterol desaturase/sphingolipid hydroxylase (fatty acid hydroxylase superfamily)